MLQQLLNAEKNGELKLSKKDILQAELPPDLIKKRKWFWNITLVIALTYSVAFIVSLWFLRCCLCNCLYGVCGPLLLWILFVLAKRGILYPMERRCHKYEFDTLCTNWPSYMAGVEYTSKVKEMRYSIDNAISRIAGANLEKHLNQHNYKDHMVIADVLLRNIETKHRRWPYDFTENHPALTTWGLPISFLCLGALMSLLLTTNNADVKAIALFIVFVGFVFSPFFSYMHDDRCNTKKRQAAKPYENLRKALNAIIES